MQLSDNDKGDALKNAEIISDADDDLAAGVLAETQHCLLLQKMNDTATQNLKKTNEFVVLDPMLSADEVFARLRGVDAIRCFVGKWGENMRHFFFLHDISTTHATHTTSSEIKKITCRDTQPKREKVQPTLGWADPKS